MPEPLDDSTHSARDLRAIIFDGAAFGVMVGVGETYLPAFALAVGVGEVAAGLVATVPMVAGAFIQLISPSAVRRLGSLKTWVVLCATVQGLSFLPLILGVWLNTVPSWLVYSVATLYWAAGMATGPAWNTWVGRLVPRRLQAAFFAKRTRIAHAFVLLGLLAGGLTLHSVTRAHERLVAFGILFLIALASRMCSVAFLAAQREPRQNLEDHRRVSPWELLRRSRHSTDGRLLMYLLAVQTATQIAGPYFTPYMLKQLHLPYATYMTLIATSFLTKSFAAPLLGRIAARLGARRLLWLGGIGLVPLPALWIFSQSLPYLLCLQVLAGLFWGAYELATFLLVFETIPEHERTSVLTLFNFTNALAMVCGSLLGGLILRSLDVSFQGYATIYAVSSLLRAGTLLLLARVMIDDVLIEPIAVRSLAVRPSDGSIERPILASISPHDPASERESS